MKRGLDALHELFEPTVEPPDPADQLIALTKTFAGNNVAEQRLNDIAEQPATGDQDASDESHTGIHKTLEALDFVLGLAKAHREEPPGLHRTSEKRNCSNCRFWTGDGRSAAGKCSRYDWPVDRDELCESWAGADRP